MRPSPFIIAVIAVLSLTAIRVATLFVTPLELHPDEAQYWLWSRTLDFGYFSKPPMIAWLIGATTAIGGNDEAWVRLSAPLLHAAAALTLFWVGRRLYGPWAGLSAMGLYALMPGVVLSSAVIATDAPLMLCLSLALLAYIALVRGEGGGRAAVALGVALGAAALSKYAALYFVVGLALHWMLSAEARRAWRPGRLGAAALAFAVVLGPNLVWNALNGFETVAHTAANTSWTESERFRIGPLLEFWGEQFGVFGPLPLLLLVLWGAAQAVRRKLTDEDALLLCFVLPPLLIISAQAFATRANANWAVAGYVPACVLVGGWLVRFRARGLTTAIVVTQGALAAVFVAVVCAPGLAAWLGLDNALKRVRGWRASTDAVLARAAAEPDLTALAVDDRFLFNAMAYYGRDRLPASAPLVIWVREAGAQNEAESSRPLTPALGGRVLVASLNADYRPEIERDFGAVSSASAASVPLDRGRSREVTLLVGEHFAPLPRDPTSGLPPDRPTPP